MAGTALCSAALFSGAVVQAQVSVRVEAAGVRTTTSTFTSAAMETFDAQTAASAVTLSNVFNSSVTGASSLYSGTGITISPVNVVGADQFGGAASNGLGFISSFGKYAKNGNLSTPDTSITISLASGVNYFGLDMQSVNNGNNVALYSGATLVYDFSTNDLMSVIGGNSAYRSGNNDFWAFTNFYADAGQTFDRVVLSGGYFESDNYTLGNYLTTSGTSISSMPNIVSANNRVGSAGFNLLSNVAGGATFNNRFDGGRLQVDGNNVSSGAGFTITGNHGYIDQNGNTATFSGVFSNEGGASGRLVIQNTGATTGRVILTGINTHSGGTEVQAGATLQIANASALGTGGLSLNGGTLATTDTLTTNRSVAVSSNNGTLDVASGKDLTLSGTVSGTGALNKTSAGRLILSGANTQSGALNVGGGTLVLSGSTASSTIDVASGTVLTGSGSTSGAVVLSGTARPGNSPGTLSVAGDFTMTAGSVLEAEIDGRTYSVAGGAGSYDRIALTGANGVFTADGTLTPVLRGISSPANNNFSPIVGDAFRVITTANPTGVDAAGAFAAVADPTAANGMPANTRFDVIYGNDFIDLVLTPNRLEDFSRPFGIQNMVNAARAFDGIRPAQGARCTSNTHQFFNGLYGQSSNDLARSVLQASGEIHAFALSEARQGWQSSTSTVGSVAGVKAERNLWVDVSGDRLTRKQDAYASAHRSSATNLWIGSHVYAYRDLQLGVAGGASKRQVSSEQSGSAHIDSQALALYALGRQADLDYSAVLSVNQSTVGTSRGTSLSTGAVHNASDSKAQGLVFSLTAGLKHAVTDKVQGRVWINGLVDQTRAKAFSEQGSSVTALGVASESFRSAQASAGYSMSGQLEVPDHRAGTWQVGAGVSHQAQQGRPQVSRQMSMQGASWTVTAPQLGALTQFVQASIRIPVATHAEAWINLAASKRQGASARGGNVGLSIPW